MKGKVGTSTLLSYQRPSNCKKCYHYSMKYCNHYRKTIDKDQVCGYFSNKKKIPMNKRMKNAKKFLSKLSK